MTSFRSKNGVRSNVKDGELVKMFLEGRTLQQIGDAVQLTRERVRQRLAAAGIDAAQGGHSLVKRSRMQRELAERDLYSLQRHGCTWQEYKSILNGPRSRNGIRPTKAFQTQRAQALSRGIEWRLTLLEWWLVWQASGKWYERGPGSEGYVMCRFGDEGSYCLSNIYIAKAVDNVRDFQTKRRRKDARTSGTYTPKIIR